MSSTEILLFLSFALAILYLWIRRHFSYWRRVNVPSIDPHLLLGNLADVVFLKTSVIDHFVKLYNHENARDQPFVGIHMFHQPALLLRSPELIKQVMVKDFNKFPNRFSAGDIHHDPIGSNNLFLIKNPAWRQLRLKLTPVFSTGKIKQMFVLVDEIGKRLDAHLTSLPLHPKTNAAMDEMKEIAAQFSTDVIASVAYGLEANSFQNPNSDFRKNGREMFTFTTRRAIEFMSLFLIPKLVWIIRAKAFTKGGETFIRVSITETMRVRAKSGLVRNDLVDVLLELKKFEEENSDDSRSFKFTDDVLIAQAAIFFTAGFETTAAGVSFTLYELARQTHLQDRLREEIRETLMENNGELAYESVQRMEYLSMVVQETLRMYPANPFLDREFLLPENEESFSFANSDFKLPHGMPVYIPIGALHRDPNYFPDPDTFNPERFAPENIGNIVPYTYMPFGCGPHNCIGERLGVLQVKIALIYFLKNHYVRPCEKSMAEMVLEPKSFMTQAKGGVYCNVFRDPV